MRFDYGYDEEGRLGKAYDLKLLRRILPYASHHRMKLALSVALVVAITLLELSVPYITKEIIDRHVVPADRIVSGSDAADRLLPAAASVSLRFVSLMMSSWIHRTSLPEAGTVPGMPQWPHSATPMQCYNWSGEDLPGTE